MIAAIDDALLDKIKNTTCHVSRKRQCNMYNFANNIKSRHEYKMLPRSKPKVLQRKCSTLIVKKSQIAFHEKHSFDGIR